MTATPVSETIPNLEFSPSERHDVVEMTAGVIAETLRVEKQYLATYGELSRNEWKQVRSGRKGMRIYKERRRSGSQRRLSTIESMSGKIDLEKIDWPETRSVADSINTNSVSGSFSSNSIPLRFVNQIRNDFDSSNTSSSNSSGEANPAPTFVYSRVPMLVGAGHVDGTLEDVALGMYAGDEVSWKERGAYIKDGYNYSRILSTILEPTPEDPYRFLGIKWFMREERNLVYTLIQDRDFLVLEATRITQDEDGVPHGYYVMHSFSHPLVPELTDRKILRCELSLCFISRQVDPNKVHLFTRGFIDPKGALQPGMAIVAAIKPLSTCMKTVATANSRKLVWLMKQRQRNRTMNRQDDEAASVRTCEACSKTSRFLLGSLSVCQACNKCVCAKCTVRHKVVAGATAISATKRLLPFCAACVVEAKLIPPHRVALDTNLRAISP